MLAVKQRSKDRLLPSSDLDHYRVTYKIERKHNTKKKNKRYCSVPRIGLRRLLALTLFFSLVLAFFTVLSYGLLSAYRWLTNSKYFALVDIEVNGNKHLSYEEILIQAKLLPGLNSFALNMREVENRLAQNPWVKAVAIKRILPDRFQVSLTERIPKFWVKREGQVWYTDTDGRLIAPVDMKKFIALPFIQQTDDADALLPQFARLAYFVADRNIPISFDDAAWIKLSYGDGFELYFEQYKCSVSIGIEEEEWKDNLLRLKAVWADLERRDELIDTRSIHVHGTNVWIIRTQGGIGQS